MPDLTELLRQARLPRGLAFDLCAGLGQLAHWVVRPDVVELARTEDPTALTACCGFAPSQPPTETGSCWVAFVSTDSYSTLRRIFALPLRWRVGVPHDFRLPSNLRVLAARVRTAIDRIDWGLGYADCVGEVAPDLSGLNVEPDSGWVPLYGGLVLAVDDLGPRPDVWATGAWDDARGVLGVADVTLKADLARELGARHLFVPDRFTAAIR